MCSEGVMSVGSQGVAVRVVTNCAPDAIEKVPVPVPVTISPPSFNVPANTLRLPLIVGPLLPRVMTELFVAFTIKFEKFCPEKMVTVPEAAESILQFEPAPVLIQVAPGMVPPVAK